MPTTSENSRKGVRKPFGSEIGVNDHHSLDPANLPTKGDWVRLKTVAHELIEVVPSKTKSGTVRCRAIRRRLSDIPPGAKVYGFTSNLDLRGC